MNDEVFILYNINKIIDDKDVKIYIIEYLNIINFSNLFSHELKLKIDIFIILLYNLSLFIELCNEICFHITYINQRIIECEILDYKYIDNIIIILYIFFLLFFIINLIFKFQ